MSADPTRRARLRQWIRDHDEPILNWLWLLAALTLLFACVAAVPFAWMAARS